MTQHRKSQLRCLYRQLDTAYPSEQARRIMREIRERFEIHRLQMAQVQCDALNAEYYAG